MRSCSTALDPGTAAAYENKDDKEKQDECPGKFLMSQEFGQDVAGLESLEWA